MKSTNKVLLRIVAICALAFAFALSTTSSAYAGTQQQPICIANGGSWSGPDAYEGTCTYPAGNIIADSNCGRGVFDYEVYFDSALGEVGSDCVAHLIPEDPSPSDDRPQSTQGNDETVIQCVKQEPYTCIIFPPGTCEQNCAVSYQLPNGAGKALANDALATAYVRVVGEGGIPGEGSYTVCFENPNHELVTIYRFIGGAWVAMAVSEGSPICTTASGDGAFYLGG